MAGYATAKGFNPFLAETDHSSPFQESQVSNPFLSSFTQEYVEPEPRPSDNPFLNYLPPVVPSGGGNPFADFFDSSANVAEVPTWPMIINNEDTLNEEYFLEPTEISFSEETQDTHILLPRPQTSLPRSTQDLLETVTGALEATSDSLLDRLRVTQPSPIPQPPSPTPSPRTPSPDLWLSDDHMPAPPSFANSINQSQDQGHSIMDLFDAPSGPKSSFEILGLYGRTPQQPSSVGAAEVPAVNDLFSMDELKLEDVQVPVPISEEIPKPVMSQEAVQEPVNTKFHQAEPEPEKPMHYEPAQSFLEQYQVPAQEILKVYKTSFPAPPVSAPPVSQNIYQPPKSSGFQSIFQQESAPVPIIPEQFSPPKPTPAPEPIMLQPFSQEAFAPQTNYQIPISAFSTTTEEVKKAPERPRPPPPVRSPVPTRVPGRPPPPVPPAPRVSHPPPPRPVPLQMASAPVKHTEFGVSVTALAAPFAPEVKTTFAPATSDVKVFDTFDDKFEKFASEKSFGGADPFGDSVSVVAPLADNVSSAWGDSAGTTLTSWGNGESVDSKSGFGDAGFGNDAGFDSFLAMTEPPPVPQSTPSHIRGEKDYEFEKDEQDISIFIRPTSDDSGGYHLAPALAAPPKSPAISTGSNLSEDSSSFVPFLSSMRESKDVPKDLELDEGGQMNRSDSQDSPQTPLYEEDQSQPLEDFPRIKYVGNGWEMHMRHPNKKKITGQRFWKKVFVQIVVQNDIPIVHIFNAKTDKDPIQEIPLQPCYSVSDISAQQFDQFGKIFTIKLQYVFYKERPGVRPGQISKAERISTKLSQFAAYAIQGDYQGVKEFGSDLRKLGLPLEHAPQISQLAKLGTQNYEEMKQFSMCIEEALFRLPVHRDRAITYKTEEVQVTLVDEYYVEQNILGVVTRQIARVRLFFLSFLSGSTEVELGVNDMRRQGREVVGRHDIIPIATEEWIRIEDVELSNCVQLDEFDKTKMVKFKPPDACYIELMRFRVRPPKHRELPLQVKTVFTTTGNRIEMRSDILVPGFTSRKLGQIPCEDVMVMIPIPECWIYMFRVEKHFRYGSVKSAHRRSGKVKGIERFLGAVDTVEQSLMEVTSGQAKYEHQHKAIVWRVARLPKDGQGAYTTHSFFCHITLQSHEQIPENLTKFCYVEFTMPHTTISHTVCRSISVPSCDEPPEKCVRYLSRHEYIIEIEHSSGIAPATYSLAASVPKDEQKCEEQPVEIPMPGKAESDSDFSDD